MFKIILCFWQLIFSLIAMFYGTTPGLLSYQFVFAITLLIIVIIEKVERDKYE